MRPNTKALLVFAGRFLLAFFLILPLWFFFTPTYNRLLAFSANIILPITEGPHMTLVGWKRNIVIVLSDAPLTSGMRVRGFTAYLTHFNLILMAALVFAPRQIEWRRRSKMLAIALGVLFITHVLYLLIGVRFFQQPELEALQGIVGRLSVWGVNFYLSVASQLFPMLLWMALYRTVSPIPGKEDAREGPGAARRKKR